MSDDPDPFAPFRRFTEQFDATESSLMSGMGWPLSPAPLPGVGEADSLSPETSTKRAVKQLYGTLAAFSGGDDSGPTTFWNQYLDAVGVDSTAFGPEQMTAATVRTYWIWFFSLTQLLVESYTLRLVHDELVVEDHHRSTGTQEWLWGLPQSDREQLLLRCTDVEDDLVEEMEALRHERDELLYTFGAWEDVAVEESLDDARRALDVLTALDDLVTDGSAFSYVPEEVSGGDDQSDADTTADESSGGSES